MYKLQGLNFTLIGNIAYGHREELAVGDEGNTDRRLGTIAYENGEEIDTEDEGIAVDSDGYEQV